MNKAEAIQELKALFGEAAVLSQVDFAGETTLQIAKENLIPVLAFLKQVDVGYDALTDLTGVDYLTPHKYTKVVYLVQNSTNYERLRLYVIAERDEVLPSIVGLWDGANWYERELYDLFGVKFEGHPDLKRILMPEDWKGHPLRRDYALTEEPVEFKNGVIPKIPSQIIPYVKNHAKS